MINRVSNSVAYWNQSSISLAGRVTLITNALLVTLIYYLSSYYILDTILDEISKLARDFFWSRGGNISGIHLVEWSTTTLDKTERRIAIRNLKLLGWLL